MNSLTDQRGFHDQPVHCHCLSLKAKSLTSARCHVILLFMKRGVALSSHLLSPHFNRTHLQGDGLPASSPHARMARQLGLQDEQSCLRDTETHKGRVTTGSGLKAFHPPHISIFRSSLINLETPGGVHVTSAIAGYQHCAKGGNSPIAQTGIQKYLLRILEIKRKLWSGFFVFVGSRWRM